MLKFGVTFESLIQMSSIELVAGYIWTETSHLHAMIMHHIVAYACVLIVGTVLLDRSCSGECSRVPV